MNPSYEQLRAVYDAAGTTPNGTEPELDDIYINWERFWDQDRTDPDWLAAPIIPAQRSVAMFAPGGAGKSLLALWISAALATGRPIFGAQRAPIHVLYLDWEMTEADLQQRLDAMGYGPDSDLTHLHYALQPPLPPLDGNAGGDEVIHRAAVCGAELVVIDTFSRAVSGDENDADTVRAWYRWTGQRLKAAGRAFLRIDHAGKDQGKGQRGSSAKNDDVDVVWHLTVLDDDVLRLKALKKRMDWVPGIVELRRTADDLAYTILVGMPTWKAGTHDVADLLNTLGLPVDTTRRDAGAKLRAAGHKVRNDVLSDAVRYRKQQLLIVGDHDGDHTYPQGGGPVPGPRGTNPSDQGGPTWGPRGPRPDARGDASASLRDAGGPQRDPETPDPGRF